MNITRSVPSVNTTHSNYEHHSVCTFCKHNTPPLQGAVLKLNMVKLFTAPAQVTERWLALVNEVMNLAAIF